MTTGNFITIIGQSSLFDISEKRKRIDNDKVESFSANSVYKEDARVDLENRYLPITDTTEKFDRQSVSYQLSKRGRVHSWLKYKEGFSAELVELLFEEMGIKAGDTVLDPFLGSGTTSFVAQTLGVNSIGFDILPTTMVSMDAKSRILDYDINELKELLLLITSATRPDTYAKRARYIDITNGAYPPETEKDIPFFTELIAESNYSEMAKKLGTLCIINSLERASYTAKDGQCLRWDERSSKVRNAKALREANGRKPFRVVLNKGDLPTLQELIVNEFGKALHDVEYLQRNTSAMEHRVLTEYKQGSSLVELPLLPDESINGVVTSPPYCNRYDYTRIYALELVYLGLGEDAIKRARQDLLSCTVESKTKLDFLKEYYISIKRERDYRKVVDILETNLALREVLSALNYRNDHGEINNKGVLRMVKGYFEELSFIYSELFRLCKPGAKVAFVNDNVRYAGEVIPVDYISTEIARQIGFKPLRIFTLKQKKGNSSQQMKKFGRVPLRKSITIWAK